jgi:hypothetical protein
VENAVIAATVAEAVATVTAEIAEDAVATVAATAVREVRVGNKGREGEQPGNGKEPGRESQGRKGVERKSVVCPISIGRNGRKVAKRLGKTVERVLFDERSEEFYAFDLSFSLVTFFCLKTKAK